MQKSQLILNKPVYIRMTILDNRNIFYNELEKIIRPQYGELLYRDTGSLLSETRTDDVYKDNQSNQNLYDTSHYPKEHPPYSNANKKKRMCQNQLGRACLSENDNILHLEGRRTKYQKIEGCKKERCQETNNT